MSSIDNIVKKLHESKARVKVRESFIAGFTDSDIDDMEDILEPFGFRIRKDPYDPDGLAIYGSRRDLEEFMKAAEEEGFNLGDPDEEINEVCRGRRTQP